MLCVGRGIGAGDVGGDENLLVDHAKEDELVQIDAAGHPVSTVSTHWLTYWSVERPRIFFSLYLGRG
jgi:hypothetical protein